MRTVFADTFYYIAFLNPSDEAHERAKVFTQAYNGRMVTTECVLTDMKREGIVEALTGNHNFEQAGFKPLLS